MRFLDRFVFDTTRVVPLLMLTVIVTLIGMSVYLGLAYWLKIPSLQSFMQLLQKMGNWRKVLKASEEIIEEPPSQAEEIKPL